jgi:hypothetical protein
MFRRGLDRIAKGVRLAEQMAGSDPELLQGYTPPPGHMAFCVVKITGPMITDPTPPDGGAGVISLPEDFFYPGVFCVRDPLDNAFDWHDESELTVLVDVLNTETLKVGTRYEGLMVGYRNGKPVVIATVGGATPLDEVEIKYVSNVCPVIDEDTGFVTDIIVEYRTVSHLAQIPQPPPPPPPPPVTVRLTDPKKLPPGFNELGPKPKK